MPWRRHSSLHARTSPSSLSCSSRDCGSPSTAHTSDGQLEMTPANRNPRKPRFAQSAVLGRGVQVLRAQCRLPRVADALLHGHGEAALRRAAPLVHAPTDGQSEVRVTLGRNEALPGEAVNCARAHLLKARVGQRHRAIRRSPRSAWQRQQSNRQQRLCPHFVLLRGSGAAGETDGPPLPRSRL